MNTVHCTELENENECSLSGAILQTLEICVVNFWQTFQCKLLSTASTIFFVDGRLTYSCQLQQLLDHIRGKGDQSWNLFANFWQTSEGKLLNPVSTTFFMDDL